MYYASKSSIYLIQYETKVVKKPKNGTLKNSTSEAEHGIHENKCITPGN